MVICDGQLKVMHIDDYFCRVFWVREIFIKAKRILFLSYLDIQYSNKKNRFLMPKGNYYLSKK